MEQHHGHQPPKPVHHHVEHKAEHKMKINKDILLLASCLIIVLLIAFTIFTLTTKPKEATGGMLYLYPTTCTTCNVNDVSSLVKGSISAFKADFIKVPVLLLPQQDTMKLIQADTKKAITQGLCDAGLKDYCAQTAQYTCEGVTKTDKPDLKLFYMAFCPYGQQAFQGIYPVVKLFGSKMNFEPHFVIYDNYQGGSKDYCIDNGKLCSMHGVNEVNEDARQLCIYKNDGLDKYLDYTKCVMDTCSVSNVETCWKTCASKNSIDSAKVESCQASDAVSLLTAEQQLDAKYNAQGSPTIFVNEGSYNGGRAAADFQSAICCGFNSKPAECSQATGTTASAPAGSCG